MEIYRSPVDSPHKGLEMRQVIPFPSITIWWIGEEPEPMNTKLIYAYMRPQA